ncbi:MAG: squalene--hopene cyclase [Planctomycetota bacterium]|nr:squalene--hopene cyclase [Planctomycetota bacterium]
MLLVLVFTSLSGLKLCHADKDTESISRGLQYLEESGKPWKEKRQCVSCHQIPPMIWAMNLGLNAGIGEVTSTQVKQWAEWSTDYVNFVRPPQKATCDPTETMTANLDTMAGLPLAIPPNGKSDWRRRFAEHLGDQQADDGTWNPCRRLPGQKRKIEETTLATTLWIANCLENEEYDYHKSRIAQTLDSLNTVQTAELLSFQILLSNHYSGIDRDVVLGSLLHSQNEDDGWGWRLDQQSDALGTGLALYALTQVKGPRSEAIQKAAVDARRFLIST